MVNWSKKVYITFGFLLTSRENKLQPRDIGKLNASSLVFLSKQNFSTCKCSDTVQTKKLAVEEREHRNIFALFPSRCR